MPQRLGDSVDRKRLSGYTERWKRTGDVRSLTPEEREDMARTLERYLVDADLEEILEKGK